MYEVRHFPVTISPGTPIATPATFPLTMPARIVRRVTVRFPPGPFGQVGVQVGLAGVQAIPWGTGQWLIGDDQAFPFDVAGMPDSGAWQAFAYNVGAYSHTVYVTFEVDPPQLVADQAGALTLAPLAITP